MQYLLNTVNFLGLELDWEINTIIMVCLLIQIVLVIGVVIVVCALIWRTRARRQAAAERALVGISLDLTAVQTEFKVGETFNCNGLAINAFYSVEPVKQTILDYKLLNEAQLKELEETAKTPFCYVVIPDTSAEGKLEVKVVYGTESDSYAITVTKEEPVEIVEEIAVAEEPVEVVEEIVVAAPVVEEPVERKLIGLKLNTDAVRKAFTVGDTFDKDGLVVVALYNVEPYTEIVNEYTINTPDMSKAGTETVTVGYGDQSDSYVINVAEPEIVQVKPEPIVIEEESSPEIIYVKPKPVVITEESFEGGTLRYDRSFTARLIQSDDETKNWYTELKNDLLSYKKVKDRMSWKRESYRLGHEQFAKLCFRGKTLCLFLPLNVADFGEDSKYKAEDVSDNSGYADTPFMYRIKNERRVKYAKELIALVAEKMNAPRFERISEDYYVAYEGIVELINKGLIKRTIKSKADEAIFSQK